jgi:hypothetical protein
VTPTGLPRRPDRHWTTTRIGRWANGKTLHPASCDPMTRKPSFSCERLAPVRDMLGAIGWRCADRHGDRPYPPGNLSDQGRPGGTVKAVKIGAAGLTSDSNSTRGARHRPVHRGSNRTCKNSSGRMWKAGRPEDSSSNRGCRDQSFRHGSSYRRNSSCGTPGRRQPCPRPWIPLWFLRPARRGIQVHNVSYPPRCTAPIIPTFKRASLRVFHSLTNR